LAELKKHVTADSPLQQLMYLNPDGWPNDKSKAPALCSPYWSICDHIPYHDGVVHVFKGEQAESMQPEMLELIHGSHSLV